MRTLALRRYAFAINAAVLLVACGARPPGVMPQTTSYAVHAGRGTSWILPEAKGASQLLYVADAESNQVSVVKLPQGKLLGVLSGFDGPLGECTDSGGDVFIADLQASQIWEYAHGAKSPKNILSDTGYYPVGCSLDPTTGNLAVTNEIATGGGSGNVAIFANASGKPKLYSDSSITQFGFCAYDDAGNLYAGGAASGNQSLFAELEKGQSKLTTLSLNATVGGTSPMRWDGEDLAILDGDPGSLIYRFKISGSTGTEVGLLKLHRTNGIGDFAIQEGAVYAPLFDQNEVGAYAYPQGGKILKTFFGFGEPIGTAVSILPSERAGLK
jgi:hypothetical protein